MDYQPPTLCIRSIEPIPDKPGWVMLDMPSIYDTEIQGPYEIPAAIAASLQVEPYPVVMCPLDYPYPPQ